jgi:hypothetical protein
MSPQPQRSPLGEAFSWASRIMAVGVAMFLPAVAGNSLDTRLETRIFGLVGLIIGFVVGLTWLIRMTTGGQQR